MAFDATFADAHLALGFGDPGGLNPLTLQAADPFTDVWYERLPQVYRDADERDTSTAGGWPLYGYMAAVAAPLLEPARTAVRIADGDLTDPSLADDAWIPWLAQAVGVSGVTVPELRTKLANLAVATAQGSRAHLTVLTQSFLTGTKSVQMDSPGGWVIELRVRSTELANVGGTVQGLAAALYATGDVPSGFQLLIVLQQQTWAQLQVQMGGGSATWAPGTGKTWAEEDSIGLAGAGLAGGAVRWSGTAVGDRPGP